MRSYWSRLETLAHSSPSCAKCQGLGSTSRRLASAELDRLGFGGARTELARQAARNPSVWLEPVSPCHCALAGVFRLVLGRYILIQQAAASRRWPVYIHAPGGNATARGLLGYPELEYCADFVLIARRVLGSDDYQRFRKLLDYGRCELADKLQARIGRALRETRPYALYPFSSYFGGSSEAHKEPVAPR